MDGSRGGRDDFFGGGFGDPFGGFGGFGGFGDPFGSSGGFGRQGSLLSSFFGGRDPFDDPFFTHPFGGMMGPSMFPFGEPRNAGFLEQQSPRPPTRSRNIVVEGPSSEGLLEQQPPRPSSRPGNIVIEELKSDDEEEEEEGVAHGEDKNDNSRKYSRSNKEPYVEDPEPYVEDPDEETEEDKSKHMQYRNDFSRASITQPQAHNYRFQSSTVTYGGVSGAYYTSSTTRRIGGDGVTLEESKEADTTTGKASHRISRGIHDKGHSVTRKLNTDGRVETMQMLHNLDEGELDGFEKAWKGNARQHFPGLNQDFGMPARSNDRNGGGSSRQDRTPGRGWALPSTERSDGSGRKRS